MPPSHDAVARALEMPQEVDIARTRALLLEVLFIAEYIATGP
jgi:hypothetical protein